MKTPGFYGWWIVGIAMLSISTSVAPFASLSIGLFFAPLNAEFGWNRAEISWCVSLLLVSSAICLPFVGRLTDRFGARAVIVPSYVMLGIGLIAIGLFVSQLWHMLLLFLMIGILSSGTQPIPFLAVLTAWFNKHRGLAIGLSVSGIGLGYAYVPILVQFMIDHHGWRHDHALPHPPPTCPCPRWPLWSIFSSASIHRPVLVAVETSRALSQ